MFVENKYTREHRYTSSENEMPKPKDHLKKKFRKIKLLSVATPRARKQLFANGDRKLIDCVSE